MLELSGEESFDRPREDLWPSLTSPAFLCRCFPGVDRVTRSDERSAAVVIRPGFSFVRGTLDVSFDFSELEPPDSARVLVNIKGIGSTAQLETLIEFVDSGGQTTAKWSIRALQFGGLLKAVSQGLMEAAARKVAADTWSEVRLQLAGQEDGGP
jgi:carbon monoxide dehydrogenase subunit G